MVWIWLPVVFVMGVILGSFLNVCIARLPLEKSVIWPSSRCGSCLQPIRKFDNIPLLSYWLLRGRCRTCGEPFSIRYFLIELTTGLLFAGLFYAEIIVNIHQWPVLKDNQLALQFGVVPGPAWVLFGFHAILFSLLLAAAACDLEHREIPLGLTVPGMLIGLVGAVLFPWPWPHSLAQAMGGQFGGRPWWQLNPDLGPKPGLYPLPVWGPLPEWLPAGSWQLGLATGIAGALVGTLMIRVIGWIFSTALGKEAIGLGDADLMMMAGAFIGWQAVVVAFFVAVLPGLVFGIVQLFLRGDNAMPFGPALAAGVGITVLCWRWIGPRVQPLFFWGELLAIVVGMSILFLAVAGLFLRLTRRAEA
jgi:leader peptidase (prepilin peptidase)/N-methyltransferase